MNEFVSVRIIDSAPPIYAVKIENLHKGATLRSLCAELDLARHAQATRIKRDPALAGALVVVPLDSPGGQQQTEVLLSWAIPIWLSGLNITRLSEEKQALALYMQQKAVDLIEQAFAEPGHATASPPPSQAPAPQSVWQEWRALGDRLEAEYEGLRREVHEDRQETRNRLAVVEYDQHNLALRVVAIEASDARPAGGLSAQQLGHICQLVQQLHAQQGYRVVDLLTGLADHFRVEDFTALPEKDWPAVLVWFDSLLEG